MGPKKSWFDKSTAQTFKLVHRSHQDPRYYDPEASNSVLVPVSGPEKNNKIRNVSKNELSNLEEEMKPHEGSAAAYGITFDDSEYDYLQHLKPMGESGAIFVPANSNDKENSKTKYKNSKLAALLDDSMLPSEELTQYNYQQQQDIPDEIKGFKPNLNEDLREALTALEDENYLDEEQDVDEIDVFGELLGNGKQNELSLNEYDTLAGNDDYYYEDEEDEDWDLDNFDENEVVEGDGNFDWEKDFSKFKKKQSHMQNDWDSDDDFSDDGEEEEEEENDIVGDLPNMDSHNFKSNKSSKKKSKRRKGAKTDTSSYSMSSSAIARTEQMTIIDDKFDVLKEKYEKEEEEEEYQPFDLSQERDDFMDMVDDFLDNYEMENRNKRIVKKNAEAESYRRAALDVTKTKMNHQKAPKLRGIVQDLDNLKL